MRHRIPGKIWAVFALFLAVSFSAPAAAQQTSCEAIYRQALNDFNAGRLERVISVVSECAGNRNNSRPLRRELLSLLAMVYTFLDEDENAEKAYLDLLELDPFHSPGTDAPELAYLAERFVTYPKFSFYVFGGPFLYVKPNVLKTYTASNVEVREISYRRNSEDPAGATFGFMAALNILHPQLDLGIGYTFSTLSFRYTAQLENALQADGGRGAANLSFFEQHRWSQIPVFLNYRFVRTNQPGKTQVIPHVYAGLTLDRMHQSSARLIAPTIRFEQSGQETSTGIILLENLRNTLNSSFIAGAGVKMHRRGFFFGADIHYSGMLRNLTETKNRYGNELLLGTFNYADSDFRLNSFTVRVGVGCFLFRSKRRYAP
ncbi:MAG: hypothetical protein SH848_02125 [Saprospiraceae bacterium]|nr:hypothetical protein [Saprospiraceae bacterium]MDZ4702695.1 hypothetical protein [Saprospiraceae bacterium]